LYDEAHSRFGAPWTYLVSFKSAGSRAAWYRNAAETEIELHNRLHPTRSGVRPLRNFDGATMAGYQLPPRVSELSHCRKEDYPWECDEYYGIDPDHVNIPISHLAAGRSTQGDHAGRGLFATRDIPAYSYLDLAGSVKAFHFWPSTIEIMDDLYEWAEDNKEDGEYVEDQLVSVLTFAYGYGYTATLLGKRHVTVDSGIMNFCNHGCNSTYSYGDENQQELGFNEMNVNLDHAPEALLNKALQVYSPVFERHLRQVLSLGDYTLRNIRKGEEILCDYLSFVGDPEEWEEDVTSLRGQCSGETMGQIQEYELLESKAEEHKQHGSKPEESDSKSLKDEF